MEFSKLKEKLKLVANTAGLTAYEIYYSNEKSIGAETLKDEISSFSSRHCVDAEPMRPFTAQRKETPPETPKVQEESSLFNASAAVSLAIRK